MSSNTGVMAESLAGLIEQRSGISVQRCYQCGKCSAGCPANSEMDYAPSVLLRRLQVRDAETDREVLSSYSLWLCLTCHTCIARCPMEVDLPKVMDILREESLRRNLVHKRAKDIVAFHRSFLDSIRQTGRLWEIGLIAEYKLRTRHFWQDVLLAPVMLAKGKLPLLPALQRKSVRRVFAAPAEHKEQSK
jgi:heterodisulfide reductase subunit C2